jgi:GNAT superfamily N-acetyltransferase
LRGLRLFIRPIEPTDQSALAEFLQKESLDARIPACGLLGKLLGEIVSIVAFDVTPEALRIEDMVVARELRRKWVGRAMLRELEQLAVKLERPRVVVEDARGAQEFFRRVGFENEGNQWIRTVR